MSDSTSGEAIVIESETEATIDADAGDDGGELFPDDRANGPMSGIFRSAQRFRQRFQSED